MTAATYDFNLSAAQTSATSMVVELQPDTSSSTPGTAARWAGNALPRLNLAWPAGVRLAQGTVNTAQNAVVDGPADYVWRKISSNPADLILDISALARVRITDDDSAGGGTGYGPLTVQDTGVQDTGSTAHIGQFLFVPGTKTVMWFHGLDSTGQNAAVAIEQQDDVFYFAGRYVNGVYTRIGGSGRTPTLVSNAPLKTRFNADRTVDMLSGDGTTPVASWSAVFAEGPTGGTRSRLASNTAGQTLLNARIYAVT